MIRNPGAAGLLAATLLVFGLAPVQSVGQEDLAVPKTAHIKIYEPNNYDVVRSPVKFRVAAVDMVTRKSGELEPGSGHHHFIVNLNPPKKGDVIPSDEKHIHWGDGRTEGELELKPGLYTIHVQFADGLHRSYGRILSRAILIRVKK